MNRLLQRQKQLLAQGRSTVALLILVVMTHAAARRLRERHGVE